MRKLLLLMGLLVSPAPAFAQDEEVENFILIADPAPDPMYAMVVTGKRTHVDFLTQPLTVIGLDEIRSLQGIDFERILQRAPGLSTSRNGGAGGLSLVRLRGSEADQVLVLLDGVPLNDVASPGGGYDFSSLQAAGIGKVEVLRSSNSTIWGSRAMGGVIALSTIAQDRVEALAEYGGPGLASLQASGGYNSADFEAFANAAFAETTGISAAANGTEPDGMRQWQAGGTFTARPLRALELSAAYRHADLRVDIDGFPAPDFKLADTNEWQQTLLDAGHVEAIYWNRQLNLRASYAISETRRSNFDRDLAQQKTFSSSGRYERLGLRGEWNPLERFYIQFGAEEEWNSYSTLFDAPASTGSHGFFLQPGYRSTGLVANVGIRRDVHDDFGGEWSLGADLSLPLFDDWEVRASFGEGFKSPSLFQLRSDFGNPALQPERSRSFDLALHKGERNFRDHFAVTIFRRDSEDQIAFVSCFGVTTGICMDRPFGTYDNIGKTRSQGVEAEASFELDDEFRVTGVYAFVESRNRTTGSSQHGFELARRPQHIATLSLDWKHWRSEAAVGIDLRVVSSSFDDAANLVPLDGYALGTIRASYPVNEQVEIFGRVENIWDEQYQTAAGYGTHGRTAYIGARGRF